MANEAVDYSYARPAPSTIAAAGYKGALRYVSNEPNKNISRAELAALNAAGLPVSLVWETTANMMLRGAAGGRADSPVANQQADQAGYGTDRPIYYACDFQASSAQFPVLADYLNNCSGRQAGFYGPYDAVEYIATHTNVKYLWQCAAWSGTGNGSGGSIQGRRVSQYACLFQKVEYVLNNSCDANVILKDDWGQFPFSGSVAPSAPTPVTTLEKNKMEIVKFTDKDNLWLHGYDRQGEFFWPIPSPADVDPALNLPTRLLANGNDDLDARFHRITGI